MGKTSSGHVAIADITKQSCPRSGVGRASLALYRVARTYKILAAFSSILLVADLAALPGLVQAGTARRRGQRKCAL
ncbi:hypothetical protein A9K55_006835 [Cordyceps militaris]|uniref:Uncharacterized protein n=1 Tax=Cordyceps militaris TaxID=73501 RepID=A0A2H4S9N3_CORMI|nr:hypothetical protein A9K55_006835 [Cordyceps militaris]